MDATMSKRIEEAVEAASDAFWAKIAEAFPDATAGDFSPESTLHWGEACKEAVEIWVEDNVPTGSDQSAALDCDCGHNCNCYPDNKLTEAQARYAAGILKDWEGEPAAALHGNHIEFLSEDGKSLFREELEHEVSYDASCGAKTVGQSLLDKLEDMV